MPQMTDPEEFVLYRRPQEVLSLPEADVLPFVFERLNVEEAAKVPNMDVAIGLGQLTRRRGVPGAEEAVERWLREGGFTPNAADMAALFAFGFWPSRTRVSPVLLDALIEALRRFPDEQRPRDSAVLALDAAHFIVGREPLGARIREALEILWPRRAEFQQTVQDTLDRLLGDEHRRSKP